MSERTSYTPGTPCWVELSGTPDIEASESFYRELFGWEMPELPNSAELGGYRRAKKNGKDVAGVSPRMEEGQPTVWATYVSVEDAEATLAKVTEAGGEPIAEPMDVMGLGTMAVFTDPTGAVCGIWQPGTFAGAELVNEPGAFGWNELGTRDAEGAKAFYGAVFGWGTREHDMGEMGTYTEWKVGEEIGRRHDGHHRAPPRRDPGPLARLLRGRGHRRRGGDGQAVGRRCLLRPDRHPGRPLRRRHRSPRRRFRRDAASSADEAAQR